ncbi:MAG: hypothetical protein M3Q07_27400 [Pseudobdellovibrionaceae bacterium]|nr:hypothetical protein [Pseudobdellovibrionaceae bacterium]
MLKFLKHLADRRRNEGTIRYLFCQLGEYMNRRGLVGLGLSFGLLITTACGPKTATTPTVERGNTGAVDADGNPTGNPDSTGTTPTGDKKPVVLPSQVTAKAQDFFNNKVLVLVKQAPCTDCHADPRQVVIQAGGLAPQNFTTMFGLLKDGSGANNNKLFNMMRGIVPHPGGAQCISETAPFCAVLQEWYREVFGEGTLSLGRVNDIAAAFGSVTGWAGSATAATAVYKVRFYLDNEAGKVAMLGETTANLEASDNNIDGPHGFTFKIPLASIDNRPHKLYAYAVDAAGKETPMAGSPYTYTAFKPKNSAEANRLYNLIFPGSCAGCHGAFTYETRWPVLLGGYGTAGFSATNNTSYNKFNSGQHSGGAFAGGAVANTAAWFREEFPELAAP